MSILFWYWLAGLGTGVVVGAVLMLWYIGARWYGDWLWWLRNGRPF